MPSTKLPELSAREYEQAAQAYLRSLPPEHFMEATPQSNQRKITLESLDLVHARRPAVQVFNELLVQYPRPHPHPLGQVVPDNMIVVHAEPIQAKNSYDVALQRAKPLVVLDYLSKTSKRKDYEDNLVKYERELKVPYYLRFSADTRDVALFRHNRRKFITVKPNLDGRLEIPELDVEVALVDSWMRYWYQGELLLLPAELLCLRDEMRQRLAQTQSRLDAAQSRLDATQNELDAKQSELGIARSRLAAQSDLARERQARVAAEQELARLRAQLATARRLRGS
jgi:Uma2 family endonuclease